MQRKQACYFELIVALYIELIVALNGKFIIFPAILQKQFALNSFDL